MSAPDLIAGAKVTRCRGWSDSPDAVTTVTRRTPKRVYTADGGEYDDKSGEWRGRGATYGTLRAWCPEDDAAIKLGELRTTRRTAEHRRKMAAEAVPNREREVREAEERLIVARAALADAAAEVDRLDREIVALGGGAS